MKKISLYFTMLAALMLTGGFAACSDDDNNQEPIVKPEPEPEPEAKPDTIYPFHFDLTVTIGQQGGMARKVATIMRSVETLSDGPEVNFVGEGSEINATYSMETILRGKYYYQVPFSADRFTKFEFKDDKVQVVQEQPFVQNTYATRNYTHAWTGDNTLVVMAANGNADKIIWTRLNTDDMTITGEGTLDISLSEGYKLFTTSGLLAYRQSDDKLFYFYYQKTAKRNGVNEKNFHVVTINAKTMAVEQNNTCPIEAETGASAYGELLQQTVFFDEDDNLYIVAFTDNTIEEGKLLRIKKGEYNIDPSYNGFPNSDGKLLTVQYLGNGKVFAYSRHDDKALGTSIDSYSHYYSVIDLKAGTRTRMAFGGQDIPYSSGRFSQRSAFAPRENKVYFGVNTETAQPQVYIYDVTTGQVSAGVKVAEGYYFEQIRLVEDDPYVVEKK
jgi:hypothetical protein